MRTIVNEETAALLTALKNIVKTESGSSKKADELEKNIIKIALKAYLLVEEKKLRVYLSRYQFFSIIRENSFLWLTNPFVQLLN